MFSSDVEILPEHPAFVVRITAPYVNNSIKSALAHRNAILKGILKDESVIVKTKTDEYPFGEDVKMVRQHTIELKLHTPAEKDEVVIKYESGMTMTEIADEYGCHYSTVGRILRQRGVAIREKP